MPQRTTDNFDTGARAPSKSAEAYVGLGRGWEARSLVGTKCFLFKTPLSIGWWLVTLIEQRR